MANQNMFSRKTPAANTVNNAGGVAYSMKDKEALAQLVCTGVFNDTYYASASSQLNGVKNLVSLVDDEYLAKLAVYAREHGFMKDMPAYLLAALSNRNPELLSKVFNRVCDNGRMVRNFVQIVRSGETGRNSLGYRPKKLVQKWLNESTDRALLNASVGKSPSLADLVRLSHPKAPDASREAFYGWIIGRPVSEEKLPQIVRDLIAFRRGDSTVLPDVPFELLTSLELSAREWIRVAENATWNQTRMNLNTFERHGVFNNERMVNLVAERLKDADAISRSKVFPYQIYTALKHVESDVPAVVRGALHEALEIALSNVPSYDGGVAVLVDTSGSMQNPVTGVRSGSTTSMRNVDVAALFASAVLHANPSALVVPFDTKVRGSNVSPEKSLAENTKALSLSGGGTDCSCALVHLNKMGCMTKLVIYVSDNESWLGSIWPSTGVMQAWEVYKKRVPDAKLVCIDISPNTTTQAPDRRDILNVGGFSDAVFDVIKSFVENQPGAWAQKIESVDLDQGVSVKRTARVAA